MTSWIGATARITIWQERFGKRLVQVVFTDEATEAERVEVVEVDLELGEAAAVAVAMKQRNARLAAEAVPVPRETNWEIVANTLVAELRAAGKSVDVERAEVGEQAITGLRVVAEPIVERVL